MDNSRSTNTADQPGQALPDTQPMAPGDEAPAGTPGTGEAVCPVCGGSGRVSSGTCAECQGTGKIIVGIGGA
jgi:hypothetical protein